MPAKPIDPSKDDEAFLSRWSRRKRTDIEVSDEASQELPAETPSKEEKTDEELLAELELPDPETMKNGDDFSAFMKARVPERLRRRALRSLWLSNPALANLDELVDYGEDFTDAATVVENMQTVYEVGKGAAEKWKAHLAALAEAKGAEESTDAAEEIPASVPDEPAVAEQPGIVASSPEPPSPVYEPEPEITLQPVPRHMRFAFE
jgi:hypothetical protein